MKYIGDFTQNKVIPYKFNTQGTGQTPIIFTGVPAPALLVYKNSDLTKTNTGVSLTVNFDSVVGYHNISIDTSTNNSFYSTGSNFSVVVATGTVDGISVVGKEIFNFSIANRSALRPLIADTTLDTVLITTGVPNLQSRLPTSLSTSGFMKSDLQSVTGSLVTTTGLVDTNVVTLDRSSSALVNLMDLVLSGYTTSTHKINQVAITDVATNTVTGISNIQSRLPSALSASGYMKSDIQSVTGLLVSTTGTLQTDLVSISGNTTTLRNLIDLVNSGYSSTTHKISSVTSVDNLIAFTGSVGSVTGSVGSVAGNVAGTVGSIVGGMGGSVSGNVIGSVGSVTGTVNSNLVAISGVSQTVWDLKTVIDNVESGYGLQGALRLILSSAAAKLTGASAGNTIYIRDINDTKNRIVASVNASGDRTSITFDIT